jgi:hypothetical protein
MAHDVFISYSTEDVKQAHDVLASIEARGIRCWIAPRNIPAGEDWSAAIDAALAASRVFITILSASSNVSQFVKREIEIAVSNRATIIPFRIEDIELSRSLRFFLSTIQHFDGFTEPREVQLEKLAERVELLLGRGPREPVQAPPRLPTPPPAPRPRVPRWVWLALVAATLGALIAVAALSLPRVTRPGPPSNPCDPDVQPESQPAMPAEFPAADAEHPLLPPDPKKSTASVVIRNETGKPLRIWRHVYRPKDSPERDNWRWWLACKDSPPPPVSMAGWTYFVVQDLEDVGDASRMFYYEVGWRFLAYDRNAVIRIRPGFFDRPDSPETFEVAYPQ